MVERPKMRGLAKQFVQNPLRYTLGVLLLMVGGPLGQGLATQSNSGIFLPYTYYNERSWYSIFSWIEAGAIGDLNGDGRNDVVVTSNFYRDPEQDGFLYVFHQGADGQLDPPVKYKQKCLASLEIGISIDIGDLNGDGRDDVVTGHSQGFEVFLQDSTGHLQPGTMYPSGSAYAIRIGDFNGDGRKDLATAWEGKRVFIYPQNSAGNLGPPIEYATNLKNITELVTGDLNNDGRTDLIAKRGSGFDNPTFSLFLQQANGTLSPGIDYQADFTDNPSGLATGDLNGDGRDDVVVTYGGNLPFSHVGVFYQNRGGTLDQAVSLPVLDVPDTLRVADINGDGRKDVLISHGPFSAIGVMLQGSDGRLLPEEIDASTYNLNRYNPYGMAVGDINSDGHPDLILVDRYLRRLVLHYHVTSGVIPPSLAVISPSGGEVWKAGTEQEIIWATSGNVGEVRIDYTVDDGATWLPIIESTPNTGRYRWRIPDTGTAKCRVRIFERRGRVWEVSANTFSIDGCGITLVPSSGFFYNEVNGVISVISGHDCPVTVQTTASWIQARVSLSGDRIAFDVAENPDEATRTGAIIIGNATFNITQTGRLIISSAASYRRDQIARDSIAVSFGTRMTLATQPSFSLPLPTVVAHTYVGFYNPINQHTIAAPLFYVSPAQVNFLVPSELPLGRIRVDIPSGAAFDIWRMYGYADIVDVAPGLFSANANGEGPAAAVALRVKSDGTQQFEPVTRYDESLKRYATEPLSLGEPGERVYLVLFGTGFRHRESIASVEVKLGGVSAPVLFAGAHGTFVGLDQLNVEIPRSLAGRGEIDVALTVEGKAANNVRVNIR